MDASKHAALEAELLALLRAALTENPCAPISEARLAELLPLAQAQGVAPLLYAAFSPLPSQKGAWAELQRGAEFCARQFYRLLILTRRYAALLAEADAPVTVLKGVGAAMYYPVPEYRKFGDIDLLLQRPDDLDKARRALEGAGAVASQGQHADYHVGFLLPEGLELELHTALTESTQDRECNRVLDELRVRAASMTERRETLPGIVLPLPQPGLTALSLLFHMLHHYLHTGFGLKLLCDWFVFWSRPIAPEQLHVYLDAIRRCGLEGFSRTVTLICVRSLGLPEACAAPLLEGATGQEPTDALLRELFDGGEFGTARSERMVALGGNGVSDYLRAFHHRTRLNFPRASRCFPLWPGLWLATLLRFLRNNRTVREVSLGSVLKSAGSRGKLSRSMGLFRR